MNEVLKTQINRLIEQIRTPLTNDPMKPADLLVAQTTRVLAGEHLMGVIAIGLDLGGITSEEMFEVIQRANTFHVPDAVASLTLKD